MNGALLIAKYRDAGSEEAFADLVRGYTDFVFSVAKRRLQSAALAEEAVQEVFVRLARLKPRFETDHAMLGWLHRTTLHVSIDLVRSEQRRKLREDQSMPEEHADEDSLWQELVPCLDEALDKLRDEERAILLLRFFEKRPFVEVGSAFQIGEDAAKMRVARALEKLRKMLREQKVNFAEAMLAAALLKYAVEAAPAPLAAKVLASRAVHPAAIRVAQFTWRGIAVGTASLVIIGTVLFYQRQPADQGNGIATKAENTEAQFVRASVAAPTPQQGVANTPFVPKPQKFDPVTTRTVLAVHDATTRAPIPGAKLHMAYFYAGGQGEVHKGISNAAGEIPIPFPNKEGDHGANIFITAEGYVPKVIGWRDVFPARYEMELDPAFTFSGHVVDEQGIPLGNVKITLNCNSFEMSSKGVENIAFNSPDVAAMSDERGAFTLPFIPRDIPDPRYGGPGEVRLSMTADGYQVTETNFPSPVTPREDLLLVVRKGMVVTGRVTDPDGRPIRNAKVREVHNFVERKLSTVTDEEGRYWLNGVFTDPSENTVKVVVQSDSWAAQHKIFTANGITNVVNFTLKKSHGFWGTVIDEDGQPLPDVTIRTDSDNQGLRFYQWLAVSKPDGTFDWTSAPAEQTLFWFEKAGYQTLRDIPLTPNGTEYKITLQKIGSTRKVKQPVEMPTYTFRYYEPPVK